MIQFCILDIHDDRVYDGSNVIYFTTYALAEDYILNTLFEKHSFGQWRIEKVYIKN